MAETTSFFSSDVKRPSFEWLSDFGANMLNNISMAILHLQVSRMKSVLHQMSDAQLDQIGIKRSQINAHAETLMEV